MHETGLLIIYIINFKASLEEETVVGSEAEEFIPRSPVPLPDVSSCKPILVQLGFSLSKKEKKGNHIIYKMLLYSA